MGVRVRILRAKTRDALSGMRCQPTRWRRSALDPRFRGGDTASVIPAQAGIQPEGVGGRRTWRSGQCVL